MATTLPESAKRLRIGRVCVDAVSRDEAINAVARLMRQPRPSLVLTPNITQVWQARKSQPLKDAYRIASLSTPDGWPIVAILRKIAGRSAVQRVAGSELVPRLCELPISVAIVGGKDNSAVLASERLERANAKLRITAIEPVPHGMLSSEVERMHLVERLGKASADLIVLGLGVPKQEQVALELMNVLDRGVIICSGATVEYIAGTTAQSPAWMKRFGLEWLFRLLAEPRKMLPRYIFATPYFLLQVARLLMAERNGTRKLQL